MLGLCTAFPFPKQSMLDEHLQMLEELQAHHRKLAKSWACSCSPRKAWLPFFLPKNLLH